MLALLGESALRSLVLGVVVFLALTALRVRNPQARMAVWTMVLAASLAMPLLVRLAPLTFPAPVPEIPFVTAPPAEIPASVTNTTAPPTAADLAAPAAPAAPPVSWHRIATVAYVTVTELLLARLLVGLTLTLRLYRRAKPIRADWTEGFRVRAGEHILAPVTFSRTILLPADCVFWPAAKRQAVLLHEGAHVANGDFFIQFMAALNCAVFWFNPFAWWLKARIIALAETISDNTVLAAMGDRPAYAEILLGIAGAGRFPMGVAMARPHTLAARVDRIVSETALPKVLSRRRRLLAALGMLPLAAIAACMTPAPVPGAKVSVDDALGGTVDGRLLPKDTSITVANWMTGVVDGLDVPGDWPRTIWITVDNVPRLMTPPAEDELPLDWIGRNLKGDRITFQQNLKYYYIDDPATVRRAATLMEVDPEDALKGKAIAERDAIFNEYNGPASPVRKLHAEDEAVRAQLASASSPKDRADLVRRQGDIGRRMTALERQLKDRLSKIPNYDKNWKSFPPKLPPPSVAVPRYKRLWAVIEEAMQNGLAKDGDSLDHTPFRSPRSSDGKPVVIMVSGNMLTSDTVARESDFVNAWRLRDTIRGDYLWYHYRFRSHYIADPAVLAQVKAVPDGRVEAQRRLAEAISDRGKAQFDLWDRRDALRDEQTRLADRDDAIRAEMADAKSPEARSRLAEEDRDVLARQDAVRKEIDAVTVPLVPKNNAVLDRVKQAEEYRRTIKGILQAAFDQGKTKPADQ